MVTFEDIKKFNPYHDSKGRFSTAGGATSFTIRTKDPAKQSWAEAGIEREKVRTGFKDKTDGEKEQSGKPETQPNPKKSSRLNEKGDPKRYVSGKDISKDFEYNPNARYRNGGEKSICDQVAEAQGFKERPTVVSKEEFDDAVKRSGVIAYRTLNSGTDVVTGDYTSEDQFAEKLMYGHPRQFALNGSGGRAYGGGIYMASPSNPTPGVIPDGSRARDDSTSYGLTSKPAVVTMTLSPNARIGDFNDVYTQFQKDLNIFRKYNADVGAYAAALGYDGLRAKNCGWSSDYLTIFNRTALIVYDGIEDKWGEKY